MGLLIVQSNFKDLDLYPLREVLKTTIHHGQGRQWRLLSGAAGHVQGMFQTYGRRQGWHLEQNDLRAAFDNVGKLMDESDLDSMLGEVGGSCTLETNSTKPRLMISLVNSRLMMMVLLNLKL